MAIGWILIILGTGLFIFSGRILVGVLVFLVSAIFIFVVYTDESRSIKKILKTYFQVKAENEKRMEREIFRETGVRYCRNLKWGENEIQDLMKKILDNQDNPTENIFDFTTRLLKFQLPTLQNRWGARYEMTEKVYPIFEKKYGNKKSLP
ncbi:hypothetical protein D4R51_03875 [bacterium]|nr:MAG: hypothetical protein D4R51_03875 [bacterium]